AQSDDADDLLSRYGACLAHQLIPSVGDLSAGGGAFAIGRLESDHTFLDRLAGKEDAPIDRDLGAAASARGQSGRAGPGQQAAPGRPTSCFRRDHGSSLSIV